MKPSLRKFCVIAISASFILSAESLFACCGKGGSKHRRGCGGVGVGVSVDLSNIGRKKREADPFAGPAESSTSRSSRSESSSRSVTKKATNKPKETGPGNVFANIRLTGVQAKDAQAETASRP